MKPQFLSFMSMGLLLSMIGLSSCGGKRATNPAHPTSKAAAAKSQAPISSGVADNMALAGEDVASSSAGEVASLTTISSGKLDKIDEAIWCLGDSGPAKPLQTKNGIVAGTSFKNVKIYDNLAKEKLSGRYQAEFFNLSLNGQSLEGSLGIQLTRKNEVIGMDRAYSDTTSDRSCAQFLNESYQVKDLGSLCTEEPRLDVTTSYQYGVVKKLYVLSEPTTKKIIAIRYLEKEQDYSTDSNAFSALGLTDGQVRFDLCVKDFTDK